MRPLRSLKSWRNRDILFTSRGASPYSIQVGAFSSMENAVNLSEQLSDQGYTSSVVK